MKILRILMLIGLAFGTIVLAAAVTRATKNPDGFLPGLKMQLGNILSFSYGWGGGASGRQSGSTGSW